MSYHYSTLLNIIWIYSESYSYKLNMQKGVISLYTIFEYYPHIFWILFVYVKSAKRCHIIIQHFWILSEYFLNLIRICLTCKTSVIFIIQHFWILSIYFRNLIHICWKFKAGVILIIQLYTFLNIIRIFSESYSYILKMQNMRHISLFNIF